MEKNESNEMRWDKVERLLDSPSLSLESLGELTAEEREYVLALRRARGLLGAEEDAEREFPLEEARMKLREHMAAAVARGRDLGAAVSEGADSRRVAPVRRFRYFLYAASILLPVLLAGVYWWGRQHKAVQATGAVPGAVADLPPTRGVQLVLSGGRRVGLGRKQVIKEQDGAIIQADDSVVTYQPSAATARLDYNTLEVPRGNQTRLVLPDGTKVWINAASRLTYPTAFTGKTREVTMEGEAFFEVSSDPAHPFVVHAKGMAVKVLGTAFDVNTYDPVLLTTLTEGKVRVAGDDSAAGRQKSSADEGPGVVLAPGDQALYEQGDNSLHKKSKVDTYLYTSWKDGVIFMKDASLQMIAEQLGRRYDYNLVFDDQDLANLHFRLTLKAPEKLQDVLNYLTSTIDGLSFVTTGREVRFFRKATGK